MNNPDQTATLDALADAVAKRIAARTSFPQTGPLQPRGEPDPELPQFPPQGLPGYTPLGPLQVGSRVGIAGIEYTQSIQYNSVSSPRYGDDNTIPLVAYKALVARVYPNVRHGLFGGDTLTGQYVTGELSLSVGDRVIYQTGPTRASGARLGLTSNIDRGLWDFEITLRPTGLGGSREAFIINCPLNFFIPAYYCRVGRAYVTVRLWPVSDDPTSSRGAVSTQPLQFLDVPAPKVCLVRVNWTDSAGKVNSPTDGQMLSTLSLAERMLPFPYFETTILGVEETSSGNFSAAATQPGRCNTAWSDLATDLSVKAIFAALFQLGDIVYGMVPTAANTGASNTGCDGGNGSGGFVSDGAAFAHELGHAYGRSHVAVPNDTSDDPNYPNYGGSHTSIGEVGIDTGTAPPTLFDPSVTGDIMSYKSKQWISPYTYQNILNAREMHQAAPIDPRRLRSLLVIDFRVNRAHTAGTRVKIKKVAHIKAAGYPPPRPHAVSPVSIDLLDSDRQVLATHQCMYVVPHGGGNCGCAHGAVSLDREPWLDFAEVIEWPSEKVASIAFHNGAGAFHTVDVGEAPRIEINGPDREGQTLTVHVRASHPREHVSVIVLFSADDGATWQPVAFDPPEGLVRVETGRLPGGERCSFRAIGTAELRSSAADTTPFDLPRTPRRLYITVPTGECGTPAGPVALAAHVDTRGLGPVIPQDIRWESNLDGELGTGYSLAPYLSEGQHELTVTAPDGLGGRLAERAIIIVGGRPPRS